MSVTEQMAVRDLLVNRLRLDLVGPSSPDEVLRQDREARRGRHSSLTLPGGHPLPHKLGGTARRG